jgi:hypothetical protein
MRKRPSAATVLAATALFFSLSGPAMAALIISNNSQIGGHTISGSRGPSADHKNIIPKSIGSSDLHDAVVSARKLNLPRIDFSGPNTDPDAKQHHVILSLDRLKLGLSCTDSTQMYLFASSKANNASMRGLVLKGPANASAISSWVKRAALSSKPTQIAGVLADSGTPLLIEALFTYRDARRVISVTLDGYVNSQRCRLDGTVIPAPN